MKLVETNGGFDPPAFEVAQNILGYPYEISLRGQPEEDE